MNRRTSKVFFSVAPLLFCMGVAAVCGVTTMRSLSGRNDLPEQTFTYYMKGNLVTVGRNVLRSEEDLGIRYRQNAWHRDPVSVAVVMTENLLPATAKGEEITESSFVFNQQIALTRTATKWHADYTVLERRGGRTTIQLAINDEPSYRITLDRPFLMGWWYATSVKSMKSE
jgi:hypothetical protein